MMVVYTIVALGMGLFLGVFFEAKKKWSTKWPLKYLKL